MPSVWRSGFTPAGRGVFTAGSRGCAPAAFLCSSSAPAHCYARVKCCLAVGWLLASTACRRHSVIPTLRRILCWPVRGLFHRVAIHPIDPSRCTCGRRGAGAASTPLRRSLSFPMRYVSAFSAVHAAPAAPRARALRASRARWGQSWSVAPHRAGRRRGRVAILCGRGGSRWRGDSIGCLGGDRNGRYQCWLLVPGPVLRLRVKQRPSAPRGPASAAIYTWTVFVPNLLKAPL